MSILEVRVEWWQSQGHHMSILETTIRNNKKIEVIKCQSNDNIINNEGIERTKKIKIKEKKN